MTSKVPCLDKLVIIMKVLFLTSNENKVTEANQTLSELGYEIEQFLINGLAPEIIEPQSSEIEIVSEFKICLLYTSPSPRDRQKSRMPSSA